MAKKSATAKKKATDKPSPEKGPVEKGPVEKGPVEKGSAEKGSAEKGSAEKAAKPARKPGRSRKAKRPSPETAAATREALEAADPVGAALAATAAAEEGGDDQLRPRRATASEQKRRAVLAVINPLSTSARIAAAAAASVWAISSEKTQDVRTAIQEHEDDLEWARTQSLADPEAAPPEGELRRSSRDLYAFLRAELIRDELDPNDPYAAWRHSLQRMRHELLPRATPEALQEVEAALNISLPPSYYDFALEWNGGELFTRPGGGYRVVSPTKLLNEVRGPLCNKMVQPYLPVVDLRCGDWLCFDTSRNSRGEEYPIYWWYGGEVVGGRVADSFGAWVRKLVDLEGHPFWWA
ncbi:MAG: SMI1/KNR4 family protein [Planctomycetota bacterium]